jgi:tetratricopeptide (TPR) repeat protein
VTDDETLVTAVSATDAERARTASRPSSRATALLAEGTEVGRYVVGAPIGAGAMGTVYEAHDPELDRPVALKLLRHAPGSEAERERREARLLGEARGLAQLHHPNVVAIYDVGRHDEGVFMAMERLRGQTLQAWLGTPRPWAEVRKVFVQAAKGLAACHAAGLMHRDLKPANVMLTDDGRVVVIDFGLVKATTTTSDPGSQPLGKGWESLVATADGSRVGTPAYMAPEQLSRGEADARSDQFALCVALYEALFGRSPFPGDTVAARAAALMLDPPRSPPDDTPVPRRIVTAVMRGLARDPDDRHPSIDALIEALEPARSRWSKRASLGALGLVVAGGAVWWTTRAPVVVAQPPAADPCPGLFAELSAVGSTAADVSTPHVLETYRERLLNVAAQTCPTVAATAFDDDPRVLCLRDRGEQARGIVAQIAAGTLSASQAEGAAGRLPPVSWCASAEVAARALAVPEAGPQRSEVAALRWELGGLSVYAKTDADWAARQELLRRADALGFAPLQVDVEIALGFAATHSGRNDEAVAHSERAYHLAVENGLHEHATRAANQLVLAYGVHLGDEAAALRWVRHAEAALALAPDATLEAELLVDRALIARGADRPEDSLRDATQAVATLEGEGEGASLALAVAYDELALSQMAMGNEAEARRRHDQAIDTALEAGGPVSGTLARALANSAQTRMRMRDTLGALAETVAAYAVMERLVGPKHPQLAAIFNLMAIAQERLGEHEQALALYQRVLAHVEEAYGPEHEETARAANNLATALRRDGQPEAARAMLLRALRIKERLHGEDSPELGSTFAGLSDLEAELGDTAAAVTYATRAVEVRQTLGPTHRDLLVMRCVLAERLADAGERAKAEAIADDARRIAQTHTLAQLAARAQKARVYIAAETGDRPEAVARARVLVTELARDGIAVDEISDLAELLDEVEVKAESG